ncbi:hypothetical protein NC652_020050 [Populus alba x Populus x berolinensis]|nr:hypothetical protein NC652_020050 [Populus alba x Populus x berolinensis]
MEEARSMLKEMESNGFVPDGFTYSIIFNGLLKPDDGAGAAMDLYREAIGKGARKLIISSETIVNGMDDLNSNEELSAVAKIQDVFLVPLAICRDYTFSVMHMTKGMKDAASFSAALEVGGVYEISGFYGMPNLLALLLLPTACCVIDEENNLHWKGAREDWRKIPYSRFDIDSFLVHRSRSIFHAIILQEEKCAGNLHVLKTDIHLKKNARKKSEALIPKTNSIVTGNTPVFKRVNTSRFKIETYTDSTKLDNKKNSQLSYKPQPIKGNEGPTLKLGVNEMTEKTKKNKDSRKKQKKDGGQLIHYRNFTV